MKKNILAENMKRFGTKNLTEQSVPNDIIEKIEGSAPYYKVYVKDGAEMVVIDFEDYEIMDKFEYGASMDVTGDDNKGQSWSVGAEATPAGGGDWDWEFNWETLEKTSNASSSGKMKKYKVEVENKGDTLTPDMLINAKNMVDCYKQVRAKLLRKFKGYLEVLNDKDLTSYISGRPEKIDDAYIEKYLLVDPYDDERPEGTMEGIIGDQTAMYITEFSTTRNR